ncbi:hypothetical protein QYE76_001948 [Lolium multiflorum]|uniref:Uncharacterized protein n=1 Tax=Lolium multiflorum TaxID=4521 RepID=A0AAD8VZU3_LOLMU|nr:hypothetical protein QYE76_001948 [Lolium multiflorum]
MAAEDLDWERSQISNQDLNMMKKLGLMKKDDAIRFPRKLPQPSMEYRVSFVDHLIRGLSAPIHDFLRGLLFVYGIQLHQTILLCLLFLPFMRMEKSKNKLSLPRTIKVPLFMKVKSQVLTNLRLPMKRKLNLKPESTQSLPLFPRRTKGKGMTPKPPAPPNPETDPSSQKAAYDPYLETLISSDEEEEVPTADVAARTTRTAQEFQLEEPVNDPLLDALSFLELIFDNYSPIPDPPEVFPSSLAKKSSVPVNLDDSSSVDLTEELKELRVQLQSVKKSLILMEQSRESSEKEKIALQQAQDAITDKDAAIAEADAAASRENSMLQLLTDASLDMADDAIGLLDLSIGLRMRNRRKTQFNAHFCAVCFELFGREIAAVICDYAVRCVWERHPQNILQLVAFG